MKLLFVFEGSLTNLRQLKVHRKASPVIPAKAGIHSFSGTGFPPARE